MKKQPLRNTLPTISLVASTVASLIAASRAMAATNTTVAPSTERNVSAVSHKASQSPGLLNPVIVTGTRVAGVTALQSSTPVQVITGAELKATGSSNLFDALRVLAPSFSATSQGFDSDQVLRSARLRGMNPGEVLVLVDGKRRHDTAIMNIYQSPNAPSNPADLDMIPTSMIDHVEVLTDGASALYGSDAVAGVINIILKHHLSGGSSYLQSGITRRGDGWRWAAGGDQAFAFGNGGYIDISIDHRRQSFTVRGGYDCLTLAVSNAACNSSQRTDGYNSSGFNIGPTVDPFYGGPKLDLTTVGFNELNPISDTVSFYSFGTVGYRTAAFHDNDRTYRRTAYTYLVYPDGYIPQQTMQDSDHALTVGVKGAENDWHWDVSASNGADRVDLKVINSVNRTLLQQLVSSGGDPFAAVTGSGGDSLGHLYTSAWHFNADIRHGFELGLGSPLLVSAGVEERHENYALGAGAPLTWELGGTDAEVGFGPSDAGAHSRNIKSVYLDLATHIVPNWRLELAGRYEKYDQRGVGGKFTGMATTRVDFTPAFALRGTFATVFHAPTLAQSYYTVTTISPSGASLQISPTSPGAEYLGALPLKPETGTDIDLGVVLRPLPNLSASLDVYQIQLDHRIINSLPIGGPAVDYAAQLNGVSLGAGSATAAFLNNDVNTRTRGVEFSLQSMTDLSASGWGVLHYVLTASFHTTEITAQAPVPPLMAAALTAAGQPISFLDLEARTDIARSSPSHKIVFLLNWHVKRWHVNLIETHYGATHETSRDSSNFNSNGAQLFKIDPAFITDLDVGLDVNDEVTVHVGGHNIFNKMPSPLPLEERDFRQAHIYPSFTPWGLDGAVYYGKVAFHW